MSQQAKRLAERLEAFNNEVIAAVNQCSDEDWIKTCSEDWSLGVVARHIAAGHYAATIELTKMIVAGQPLPEFTAEGLIQMANDHAEEHAGCTKEEVLNLLRENGAGLRDYTAGLSEDDLHKTTHSALLGGDITAGQFVEAIILQSAGEHFASIKAGLE